MVANNDGQKSFLKELWNIFLSSTVDCCTSSAKLDCSCELFRASTFGSKDQAAYTLNRQLT